ncbi:MAG: ribose 5-phosphate isomerase B [Eggerthia catenaformis]|uniref:ribose 5-phosphate isomerase B n=1 Tax=Eggerthia catenaformis TaxID=31973 RepID=UPI003FA06C4A
MTIAIACDHGGYRLKNVLFKELQRQGYKVKDFGTYSEESCDYPDYAGKAAKAVASGECDKGVVVCGTGIGVSITANKVKGIRCALCHDVFSAKATRNHNDANMLAMGQRVIGEGLAIEVLNAWLSSDFEGGRHIPRIEKMMALEKEQL